MILDTVQLRLGDRELQFSYPQNEAEMIRSVLNGEDYPLTDTRGDSTSPVIVDVGSNCGAAAVYFKINHPSARVICYEPSISTFELLNRNVEGIDKIETYRCGIWNKEGTFRLHHAPNNHSGAATLRPGENWPNGLPSENITTRTLSSELTRLGLVEVNILKIDAETAEAEILQEVLTNAADVPIQNIFVEYHGIAVRKFLTEELSARYDTHLCSVSSDRQGTLLFVLRKTDS